MYQPEDMNDAVQAVQDSIDEIHAHARRYMAESKMLERTMRAATDAMARLNEVIDRLEQDFYDTESALIDEEGRSSMLEQMLRDEGIDEIPN